MSTTISKLRKFVAPEIIFGIEARKLAGKYSKNLGATNVLLVSDPGVIAAGWTNDVIRSLELETLNYTLFSSVTPNPRAIEVMTGAELYKNEHCDAIVAVGGGSPMDCAKGIGIVCSNNKHILEFEGVDKIRMPVPPLIFIPTTAGSSADVSQFAIITHQKEQRKIAIISKTIVPDVALIDPETTTTMDAYLTACTGLDVLAHAIEAFVSTVSSPITDIHALEAIKLVTTYLIQVVKQLDDIELREKVMLGSMQAGLAFSNAVLGAVHAMAHSLGGFLDLPHGECNAILLEHVINFNYEHAASKFEAIAQASGIHTQSMNSKEIKRAFIQKITDMKQELHITRTLGQLGVKRTDIPKLALKASKDVCLLTNPREATQRDIEVIYEEAL